MHTDAAQSIGKIAVDVDALDVDLLTIAGHKFNATKGVGVLFVRRGTPIAPVLVGADHEGGLRSGTENVPAIVGLGEAARLALECLPQAEEHMRWMRDLLHRLLAKGIPGLALNGHSDYRLPNTLNVSFPGVRGRELLAAVQDDISASVGSACHAGSQGRAGYWQPWVSTMIEPSVHYAFRSVSSPQRKKSSTRPGHSREHASPVNPRFRSSTDVTRLKPMIQHSSRISISDWRRNSN